MGNQFFINRQRIHSVAREVAIRGLSGWMPYFIINEFPKSGGTWLGQLLSGGLDVPFVRNSFPPFHSSIFHGHFLSSFGMNNVVVIWRDGRDVMTSWYHHCLFELDHNNSPIVAMVRKDLGDRNFDNVQEHLPDFIEYAFTRQYYPRFTWSEFVNKWYGQQGVSYVRYEDLLIKPVSELQRLCGELRDGCVIDDHVASQIVDRYSFNNQSGRRAGIEEKNKFLRKGISGDWKNYFTESASEVFDFYAGKEMKLLGYR